MRKARRRHDVPTALCGPNFARAGTATANVQVLEILEGNVPTKAKG